MLGFLLFLSSGLFLGWSLGANDGATIFGTAVGSKMLKFKTAALTATAFVIIGAVFAGSGTSSTLNKLGTINAVAGAFMVELSAAITVYLMVRTKIITSTSQAIVGAIIGWNFYSLKATNYALFSTIAATWVIGPVLASFFAICIYYILKSFVKKCKVSLLKQDAYIRIGLILSGAFSAYALGANNIANVMGVFIPSNLLQPLPLPFGLSLSSTQVLFLIGAIAIGTGIFTYSQKNIDTISRNITQISPFTAWIVIISQSLVLFIFASTSLHNFLLAHNLPTIPLVPVSSSQATIGAIMGIGLLKGGHCINWRLISRMITGWIATPLISGIICYISLFVIANVFGLQVYK
ncbi:MAG: inorganic phosphate transporter [Alphaproteobacteria bacterium]|nr:inorganic phosphate transporter [Alphaproteobacteria bacterium]